VFSLSVKAFATTRSHRLCISQGNVKTHINDLFAKADLCSWVDATRLALALRS
jgi:DNA-binding NarL/FixJ family response regulator